MKILYHHRTMGRGAEGIHIASIVKALEALGHEVVVVSPPGMNPLDGLGNVPLDKSDARVGGLSLLWKLISRKAPQFFFELLEIFYNFHAIVRMKRILEREKIDFLYERNAYFLFAGAYISRKFGLPLAIEANEVVGIKRARGLVLKQLAASIEKYAFRRAKAIFVVSSYLHNRAASLVGDRVPVFVTPNAVDPAIFERSTRRDAIRSNFNISDKTVLGFAGWFDWWDRLDLLLEVLKSIMDAGYGNVAAMLIGDGPLMSELKAKARKLDIDPAVVFTGPVARKNVIDYLDAVDIGVLPHSNEFGSPVVLFEMMALGKPVVAPSLMPIRDVVADNQNGLLFPPLDREALVRSVRTLIDGPELRLRLGSRAREIVMDRHTWVRNARKVVDAMSSKPDAACHGDTACQ
jgi:glycosyltransferase involved in cell wall biosynthesis